MILFFLPVFEGWYIPTLPIISHFVWAFKPMSSMSSIILHADHWYAFAYMYIEHFLSFDFLYFIQKMKYLHENVKFVYVKTEMCKVDRNLKRHSLLYAKYPIQSAMALAVTELSSTNAFIFNVKLIFITIMDVIMNYVINFSTFSQYTIRFIVWTYDTAKPASCPQRLRSTFCCASIIKVT